MAPFLIVFWGLRRTTGPSRYLRAAAACSLLAAAALAHSRNAQQPPPSANLQASATAPANRPDAARFRARVESILAGARANRAYWGILVADRDTGRQLYSLNPGHFFTPASNAKLFTTALALATLGPDYRFRTTLESTATLTPEGRLPGDLILVGRGDPDLSNRKFPYDPHNETDGPIDKVLAEMADAAVAKGLRQVDGDIVGDDTCFSYDPYPAGWNTGDLFFKFGAPVSAIAFNDNIFSVEMRPGSSPGDPPAATVQPEAAGNTLGMELAAVAASEQSGFAVVRQPGANFLLLRGAISPGHPPMRIDLAIQDPAAIAAAELKLLLEARGVKVNGAARARHAPPPRTTAKGEPLLDPATGAASSGSTATPLAEHLSQPLLEIVRVTNKVSQNLHAELLLRTVGKEKLGLGSTAAGLKVERDFLQAAGVADGDVFLSDGSGLARDDLVTPQAVVTLLNYALRQPWGEAFLETLPLAGVDGTLENRMKKTSAAGFVQAKTGSSDHVRAISGYATTRRGEYLVFSIFANNNPQHGTDATSALDAIATAMVETLGANTPAAAHK